MIYIVPTLKEPGPEPILIQDIPALQNSNDNLVDAQSVLEEEVVTT